MGRPREHWLLNTLDLAFNETTPQNIEAFDHTNEHHMKWLTDAAEERDDIFETKPKILEYNPFKTKNAILNWGRLLRLGTFVWSVTWLLLSGCCASRVFQISAFCAVIFCVYLCMINQLSV